MVLGLVAPIGGIQIPYPREHVNSLDSVTCFLFWNALDCFSDEGYHDNFQGVRGMSNPPNAIFYGRVSTDRQDTRDEQLAAVREFCERTDGLMLDGDAPEFYESAVTGKYFTHGAYLKMLDYISQHPNIRYIVVRQISRFGRAGHIEMTVERKRLGREFNVEVLSTMEPHLNAIIGAPAYDKWGNRAKRNTVPMTGVMRAVQEEADFKFREDVAEVSRQSIMQALREGTPPGGRMPAFFAAVQTGGIKYSSGQKRRARADMRVVPDPATREHHQAMFDFIASGGTLTELSRWLAARGITSPGIRLRCGITKGAPGTPFNPNTLRYNLMNYMFIGEYCYNRYCPQSKDDPQGRRLKPREYWHIFENYCEPTVDRETFFKVQNILENGVRTEMKHPALLTGILYCGVCGSKMTVVTSNGASSYRCSGKKNHTAACNATEVTVKSLDGLIEKLLLGHYFSPDYVRPFCEGPSGIVAGRAAENRKLVRELEERDAQLTAQVEEAKAVEMSLHLREALIGALVSERAAIARELKLAGESGAAEEIDYTELSASLKSWWDESKFAPKRAFVRQSFQRLVFTRTSRKVSGELSAYSKLPSLASPSKPIVLSA